MAGLPPAAPASLLAELPVEVLHVETVVPSAPTDCSPLLLSFLDRLQDGPVTFIFFYRAGGSSDMVATLRQALSDVLVPYHFMAGRLSPNREFIDCNSAGALFAAASCPLSIADLGDVTYPNLEFAKLVLRAGVDDGKLNEQPILTIQVTKFKCGGWSLGVSTRQAALDGIAGAEFFMNYASLARGEPLVVEPKPDRSMLRSRDPPQIKFEHLEYLNPSDLPFVPPRNPKPPEIFKAFPFNADMLNRLKALALSDPSIDKCSTFEAMAAHVWRVRTKALNLPPSAPSSVSFIINFRSRMEPPLPDGFAGNAIISTYASVPAEELCNKSLSFAVQKLQEANKVVVDEYIRSSIDFGTTLNKPLLNLIDGFLITTWCKIPFHLVDFGWGKPIHVSPIPDEIVELVMLLSNGTQHGLNLFLSLLPSQLTEFEKLIYDF